MGTRSTISICKKPINQTMGEYKGVYCHWDGYPSYNGRILLENYNTEEKVEELISHGGMSSLGEKIEPDPAFPHTFDKPQKGVCVFYTRDRGEKWEYNEPHTGYSQEKFYDGMDMGQEYDYLFEDGKWYYRESHFGGRNAEGKFNAWRELTLEVCDHE